MNNTVYTFHCAFGGRSMHPTLAAHDLLAITPYAGRRRPRTGDVILCTTPIMQGYVVHRIIARTRAGYRTRGDNCSKEDPWLLTEEEIIGLVVAACRERNQRPIYGGPAGRLWAMTCHLRRVAWPGLAWLLRPLARSLRHLFSLHCDLRLYSFANPGRTIYRLMAGQKTVGVFDPAAHRWHLALPYRLFMNKSTLPRPMPSPDPAGQ